MYEIQNPWQSRNYNYLQASVFLSTLAIQMQTVAVGWQVYEITNSAFSLGIVGLCIFLPLFFLAILGGYTADHYSRKNVYFVCHLLLAACALGLLITSETEIVRTRPVFIYIFLIFFGAIRAFSRPAGAAILGDTVPLHLLPKAIAISSTNWQLSAILGPAAGGLIYGVFESASSVFTASTLLFSIAGILISRIDLKGPTTPPKGFSWNLAIDGLRYVRSRKIILGAMSLDLFAVLLGGSVALLPIYAKDILGVGPFGLGVLRSAPGAGALIAAIYLTKFPVRSRMGKALFDGVMIFGIATCVFGISANLYVSLAALAVLGAADMVSIVVRHSLIQVTTPPEMRGRVSSVSQIFVSASNELGEFESGFLAAFIGAVPTVIIGGVGTCIVVVVWKKCFPELLAVDNANSCVEVSK